MSGNQDDFDADDDDEAAPSATKKMRRRFSRPLIDQFSSPAPVRWLWQDRIALGKVTLIEGPPGAGKSFVVLDLAARVSLGAEWPDEPSPAEPWQAPHAPADVLVLFRQDDPYDTVSSRLEQMGGDPEHLFWFDGFLAFESELEGEESCPFSFPDDLPALVRAVHERKTTRLIVIDSLSDFCRRPDQLEETLHQLNALAVEKGIAIMATLSATCRTDPSGRLRTKSRWPTGAARSTWCVVPDPQRPSRRLFVPTRMNFCAEPSGMAFEIQDKSIVWDSTGHVDVADPVRAMSEREAWVMALLADGPQPAPVVYRDGRECGYTSKMLRVAAESLGVHRCRIGFGKSGYWEWSLAEWKGSPGSGSQTETTIPGTDGPAAVAGMNVPERTGRNGHVEEYPVFARLSDLMPSKPVAACPEPVEAAVCGNASPA